MQSLVPTQNIAGLILFIRGKRVMIDADLAKLYGVSTKVLNQAVKRNIDRFPSDFMFALTAEEKMEVVTICDHLGKLKFSPVLPKVFTEHGAVMLANVLKSPRAIQSSIAVVRAFIQLQEILSTHKDLARKLFSLEKKYDSKFKEVFQAIRQLMSAPDPNQRKIGFLRNR